VEEAPARDEREPTPLRHPGMVIMRTPGNVVALSSGQQNWEMRFGAEKYAKFAYSSRYGFSVEADERQFRNAAFDGALGLSDDGRHYRVREQNETAQIAGTTLFSRWTPWSDVRVETWLLPANPWHIRVHRITTPRRLESSEGGFAVARADMNADATVSEAGRAEVRTPTDVSAIADLSATKRQGVAHKALPNTNLLVARTIVPQLRGTIEPGVTVLVTAVAALPAGHELMEAPAAPDIAALEALFAAEGVEVSAIQVPERF
jgi:hypothetical protein